jgi:hypothetical protein
VISDSQEIPYRRIEIKKAPHICILDTMHGAFINSSQVTPKLINSLRGSTLHHVKAAGFPKKYYKKHLFIVKLKMKDFLKNGTGVGSQERG